MVAKKGKLLEKDLYEPIMKVLQSAFSARFGNCQLEITAGGSFSPALKGAVPHDIIFAFLGKKASPDLTGFVRDQYDIKNYIVVEIKRGIVTLQDVYQVKMYGDLFSAKYALLLSPQPVPEEIKRLHNNNFILNRFMSGWGVHIAQWDEPSSVVKGGWFPQAPF